MINRSKEFIGRKRGKLTVLRKLEDNPDKSKELWEVFCECGTLKTIKRGAFSGLRSCGCLKHQSKRQGIKVKKSSWDKLTPEQRDVYDLWAGMRARCRQRGHFLNKDYGGRGITVCEEWSDFNQFWLDMGPRPEPKELYSLEREDVNQGYSKANCKWILKSHQGRNTRRTIRIIYKGLVIPLLTFLETTGLDRKDFTFVTAERKKNGSQPVEVTEVVKALCTVRGLSIPEGLK